MPRANSAEQLLPFLRQPRPRDHDASITGLAAVEVWMPPILARFDGRPIVLESGDVVSWG